MSITQMIKDWIVDTFTSVDTKDRVASMAIVSLLSFFVGLLLGAVMM